MAKKKVKKTAKKSKKSLIIKKTKKGEKKQNNKINYNPFAVMGFIFSFLGWFSILGIILSFSSLFQKNKKGRKLAIAGVIIGFIMLYLTINNYI